MRSLRILFSLSHPGYLRHYEEPIRILVARGHSVHLAFQRDHAKDEGDDRLLERLVADSGRVTAGVAPRRSGVDGWRPIAWSVRALVDLLRYTAPAYRDAHGLRRRAAVMILARLQDERVGGTAHRLATRIVDRVARDRSRSRLRQLLRLAHAIEDAIPPSKRTTGMLSSLRPDIVLASPVVDFGSPQVEFVKSAQRLRIPCAVCVASWDNLTNKGLLRVVPDRVLVWNEQQRQELAELHAVPEERVVVTGGQKFDPWFDLEPTTARQDFARAVGLDPERQYLLYVCSSRFIAPDEVPAIRRWIAAVRGGPAELRELGILVRPHPQNAEQWATADLSEWQNVAVWPRHGAQPDDDETRAAFFDSIHHSSGVVGINTSAQIEAGIIGRPVYTILSPEFASAQEGTLHFQYLRHENGGFVHEATDLGAHLVQLGRGIAHPEADRLRIGAFVESFVRPRGIGEPVAPIVADEIESLALVDVSGRRAGAARRTLLRLALTPLAGVLALAALVRRMR
ncbi:MAG TPA: hypothetical protein VNI55_05625 [Gaiellaceae bacterium]|nr:hypothetical protein [Gaiellaceae bacterium]